MAESARGLLPGRAAAWTLTAGVVLCLALSGCRSTPRTLDAPGAGQRESPRGPFVRALGTVQDGGLPHVACSHELCERARRDPALRRRVASLAIVLPASGEVYLVDATPDLPEQLEALADVRRAPPDRVDRAPVDGVFLTHAHVGHYLGLAFFGFEAVHTRALPVWATPRMATFLRRNGPWSQLVSLENITLRELPPGAEVSLDEGVRIRAVSAPHRDEYADTVGFRVEGPSSTVLYVPDTDSWDAWGDRLARELDGVDAALVDGTFFSADELPGRAVSEIGHPLITDTLERLGDRVEAGGLEVFFTHLNHSNPALDPGSPERREIDARGFRVLAEGWELDL